jgi:hypothetical protein
MAKSISVYDIIDFTLSIVPIGFRGLTVVVPPSRKFDSRKGDFMTPVKLRYGTGTVRYRTVPYRKYIDPYCTVLLRLRNGKINVSYEVRFRKN